MPKLALINYHYIRKSFSSCYPGIFGVTPNHFLEQLNLLQNEGRFIHQKDLKNHIEYGKALPEKSLIITFDDGLAEQYFYALPILQKLNIPAVFFVNSSIITNRKILSVHKVHLIKSAINEYDFLSRIKKFTLYHNISINFDDIKIKATKHYQYDTVESALIKYLLNFELTLELREYLIGDIFNLLFRESEDEIFSKLYMNSRQIKKLADLGYLGSHGHNHLPIGLLSEEDQIYQLQQSKSILEEVTQQKIYGISFPYGSLEASNVSFRKMETSNYVYGVTIEKAVNTVPLNRFYLARLDCNSVPLGKSYKYADNNIFEHYSLPAWKYD